MTKTHRFKGPWTGITGTGYTSRRKRGLAAWAPEKRLGDILDHVIQRLNAERAYWPLTDRHEGYQLVSHLDYEKNDQLFDDVETVCLQGRRSGRIPWEAIDDGRSETDQLTTYKSVDEWFDTDTLHLDLLAGQEVALEVWVEAAGMISQSADVASEFTIPVMSSGGFRTVTAIHDLAERALERYVESKQRTVVLLTGDLDEDGISAIDSTADDAWAFLTDMSTLTDEDEAVRRYILDFDIVALTPEQVEEKAIPTHYDPAKKVRRGDYDGPAVQLEALDAEDYAVILRTAIESHLDLKKVAAQRRLRNKTRTAARRRWNGTQVKSRERS